MGVESVTELLIRAKNLTAETFAEVERELKNLKEKSAQTGKDSASAFGPFGKAVDGVRSGLGALGLVSGGLAIGSLVTDFIDLTGSLSDTAAKTDLTIRQLQRFSYAGETAGITTDQIAAAVAKLQVNLGGEDDGALGALERLGINLDEFKAKNPGDQFEEVASALAKIENPAQRAKAAVEIFGKGGTEILPLLRQDLKAVGDEAERVGAVLGDDDVAAGDALGDIWTKLKAASRGLVAEGLRPILETVKQINDPGNLARWESFKASLDANPYVYGWKELGKWINAAQAAALGGNLLDAPKLDPSASVRKLFDTKTYGIQLPKMSPKELNDITEQLNREVEASIKANKAADEHAEKIKKLAEAYRGLDAITAAKDAVDAFHQAERAGFTARQMSIDDAKALNKVILDAIDVNLRAGKTVPEEWQRIARETTIASMQGVENITTLIQAVEGLQHVMMQTPAYIPKGLDVTGGLAAGTQIGQDVGLPQIPKISKFFQIFGTSKDFGQQMAGTILGAIQGGGNPVQAAAGQVGGQIATHVAKELTTQGGKFISGALGGAISAGLPIVGTMIGPLVGKLFSSIKDKFFGTAGRDSIKDFAESLTGSSDLNKLHDYLGKTLPDDAERFWKLLTQETGRNNAQQAAANIAIVNAALEEQKKKQDAAGDAAQRKADAVAEAEQKAADAVAEVRKKIQSIDQQVADLDASEAVEENMGLVEQNARANLARQRDALTQELAATQAQGEATVQALKDAAAESFGEMTEAVNRLTDALRGIPGEVNFTVRGRYEDGGVAGPRGQGTPEESHADGAYIREDHAAMVHANEMIGPVEFFAAAVGRALKANGSQGTGDIHFTAVMPDGEVLTRQVVRRIPGYINRFGRT